MRVVTLALWRRHRTVWSAIAALVGLAVIGAWLVLTWRIPGLVIFAAVVVGWALSPYVYRLYQRMLS